MAWKQIVTSDEQLAAFRRAFKKKARILLDEHLDPDLASGLRGLGWNVRTVEEARLRGRSDEDILAYTHRENRILITNDNDFRNERRFPPHRNPGLVIVPDGLKHVASSLEIVLPLVGHFREVFRGAVIQVDRSGLITVRNTEYNGRRTTTRYRLSDGSYPLLWED